MRTVRKVTPRAENKNRERIQVRIESAGCPANQRKISQSKTEIKRSPKLQIEEISIKAVTVS